MRVVGPGQWVDNPANLRTGELVMYGNKLHLVANGGSPAKSLILQGRDVPQSTIAGPCYSFGQDWLIEISPPVAGTANPPNSVTGCGIYFEHNGTPLLQVIKMVNNAKEMWALNLETFVDYKRNLAAETAGKTTLVYSWRLWRSKADMDTGARPILAERWPTSQLVPGY